MEDRRLQQRNGRNRRSNVRSGHGCSSAGADQRGGCGTLLAESVANSGTSAGALLRWRGDLPVVGQNSAFNIFQIAHRMRSVARQDVERHLRIKDFLWQLLEGKQVDRLLMQLIHSTLSLFAGRLKDSC